ncbi:MAG: hypothetical protein DWQ34_01625 [Planctomycetota bacterium]|nr:MAG: hypothetical protein DWQ29_15070 [Planctomycetota bacterium]REJ97647.1 MAG: hypothetical protein DWQ34_01625 [Planctomycetota bacterium]REK19921.1 MAG: hypothetical protein DWQ41_26695 [Planctomycetota bacterium]REK27486.1 MAG: hypothetical protein DWQ45_25710 [Planctomycetota bacterium]
MSAREEILERIRQHGRPETELPGEFTQGVVYDDRLQQFREVLESIGGQCCEAENADDVSRRLESVEAYSSASKIVSLVPGVGRSTFDVEAVDDPHDLEDVDFAILPGRLAVAENAAIWVTDDRIRHRVLYFLPQHLALVVPADRIVHNMHEAYAQIDPAATRFAAFIAGPSKTADIEQSLVIGAHGAKSLTVILIGRSGQSDGEAARSS